MQLWAATQLPIVSHQAWKVPAAVAGANAVIGYTAVKLDPGQPDPAKWIICGLMVTPSTLLLAAVAVGVEPGALTSLIVAIFLVGMLGGFMVMFYVPIALRLLALDPDGGIELLTLSVLLLVYCWLQYVFVLMSGALNY